MTTWTGAVFVQHRRQRRALYERLTAERSRQIDNLHPGFQFPEDTAPLHDEFERERILRIPDILTPEWLARLRDEAEACTAHIERSYVPTHKQGGTVCYERIHCHAPACLATYHDPRLSEFLSRVFGCRVVPTAIYDQSSCSILCYTEPGDHIGWHFDHNFYKGRHFTVLISLVNTAPEGKLSSATLQRRRGKQEQSIDTAPNVLVAFEGARVCHRATPLLAGERRIVLSMTFATDPRTSGLKEFARRVKDTAFFGLRTLWD